MTPERFKELIRECIQEVAAETDTLDGALQMRRIGNEELDEFAKAYITAALWSSTDNLTPSGGEPLDKKYTIDDICGETLHKMERDCREFYDKYAELYHRGGWADDRAGHDFWLTRNGHGAGFWSREMEDLDPELHQNMPHSEFEEIRETLTKAAKSYGEFNLYLGDGMYDGLICGG